MEQLSFCLLEYTIYNNESHHYITYCDHTHKTLALSSSLHSSLVYECHWVSLACLRELCELAQSTGSHRRPHNWCTWPSLPINHQVHVNLQGAVEPRPPLSFTWHDADRSNLVQSVRKYHSSCELRSAAAMGWSQLTVKSAVSSTHFRQLLTSWKPSSRRNDALLSSPPMCGRHTHKLMNKKFTGRY